MSKISIRTIKPLNKFPILHRFLAILFKRWNIYKTDDMLECIKDDKVCTFKINDDNSISIYLSNEGHPLLKIDSLDEGVKVYKSENGLLALHLYSDGDIKVEALEYEHYPFREEAESVYNQSIGVAEHFCKSDVEDNLVTENIQKSINEYFKAEYIQLTMNSTEWLEASEDIQ